MKIKFAQLHSPIFLAGTNLQDKLDPVNRTGLELTYNDKSQMLMVTWNGQTGMVPRENVRIMVEGTTTPRGTIPGTIAGTIKSIEAQVETPMSHVFAGPGAGDTGVGKRTK